MMAKLKQAGADVGGRCTQVNSGRAHLMTLNHNVLVSITTHCRVKQQAARVFGQLIHAKQAQRPLIEEQLLAESVLHVALGLRLAMADSLRVPNVLWTTKPWMRYTK